MEFSFTYKGIEIDAVVTPRVTATWTHPPMFAEVESFEWEIVDEEELRAHLDCGDSGPELGCRALDELDFDEIILEEYSA